MVPSDAWLGRGLCFIRQDKRLARRDMQTAAALETKRSIFHSYLGKLSAMLATKQKQIWSSNVAKRLDPKDPTPWIYSAIERSRKIG